ncbi:MAG: ABC transporter substrate-binding protein [Nitrospiraceae bacterium]|nr:MAG: ABC transporter substrate-binding protein [Nitrospiraceae bacterium]
MKTKLFLFIIITIFSIALLSAYAAAGSPKEGIRTTVDSVLEVLRDKSLSLPDKKEDRRSKLRSLIKSRFDFSEMSMRTLARHWKARTPEEAREFIAIFSDLLVGSYIGKIEAYTDEKVIYNKEVIKGEGRYATVSTTIVTKKVDIPIDYRVILRDGEWRVYDVVIEGVSFISTYRSQYDEVIAKESYAGLIKKMKEKLDELNAM